MKSSFLAFVVLAVSSCAEATYSRTTSLSGESFLDAFSWQAAADPTKGRVDYVDRSTAESHRLYSVSGNTLTLRADHTAVVSPFERGRKSFRLQSNEAYSRHVAIFDIGHMPQGCGTWPAVFGANWPNHGEIDIVEGVNNKGPNQSTLHTGPNCTMTESRWMTGRSVGNNCASSNANNAGCGVRLSDGNSFGPDFNNNGGGWYAVERAHKHIAIYFWERGSSSVPSDVENPGNSVDPKKWGTPAAYFQDTDCDFASHFGAMHIIINLTFCGEWAGAVYRYSGCPSTCHDYVDNNPSAFSDAYFEFNSLNIYE